MEQFSRNILLIGEENQNKLINSTILLFGVGGVGSYTFEALVRAGIGKLIIVDFDKVLTRICYQGRFLGLKVWPHLALYACRYTVYHLYYAYYLLTIHISTTSIYALA